MKHHAIIPAAGLGRRMGDADPTPKCLLPVAGRPLLLYTLDALAARHAACATLIVGHGRDEIANAIGTIHRGMPIAYVENADFAVTEHGWSLFLSEPSWQHEQRPVLLMDADNVFDPQLLDVLLTSPAENTVLIDPHLDSSHRDEELVLGSDGRVSGFVRGRASDQRQYVGGFVGMNRFSAEFMRTLFGFMRGLFARGHRDLKYERVFHRLLSETSVRLDYLSIESLSWINVNHPHEVAIGERIVAALTPTCSNKPSTTR